jgi:hypothetical protein
MAPRHATLCILVSIALPIALSVILLPAPLAGVVALLPSSGIEFTLTAAPACVQLLPAGGVPDGERTSAGLSSIP